MPIANILLVYETPASWRAGKTEAGSIPILTLRAIFIISLLAGMRIIKLLNTESVKSKFQYF